LTIVEVVNEPPEDENIFEVAMNYNYNFNNLLHSFH